MMDWLTNYLPDGSDVYWAILCVALAVLNVWQFARTRDLSGTLKHVFEHGVAPEGKALVPADSVKVRTDEIERQKAEQQSREATAETAAQKDLAAWQFRTGPPPPRPAVPPPWEQPK